MRSILLWLRWIIPVVILAGLASCGSGIPMGYFNGVPPRGVSVHREPLPAVAPCSYDSMNNEEYNKINENPYVKALDTPLSTFSIDVDTASYGVVRSYINRGMLPPKDAVRIEELINYFTYACPEPMDAHPVAVCAELSACPWNKKHRLVHIGLKGKSIPKEDLPHSNLIFLIDVSGSMKSRLNLVKSAMKTLVDGLREDDRITVVTYADKAALVLPPTWGMDKTSILMALDKLKADGNTAGSAGLTLAYQKAKESYLEKGNNRIIVATDGDFNVGPSSQKELLKLIEEKRKEGIFLTVLGFGKGNYKDAVLELLADKGNGNYTYIDTLAEAQKALAREAAGTLFTIAKDLKVQVEFNPAKVESYRLIGYENRKLKDEDFKDDTKDAGELGAGHRITALYEIVPRSSGSSLHKRSFTFSETVVKPEAVRGTALLTIKLRYKRPNEKRSVLLARSVHDAPSSGEQGSSDFRFAAAVAEFGLLLRDSPHKGAATFQHVIQSAKETKGSDSQGYRSEFIKLAEAAQGLQQSKMTAAKAP
jgi:Ca-activated chloride channel family protein